MIVKEISGVIKFLRCVVAFCVARIYKEYLFLFRTNRTYAKKGTEHGNLLIRHLVAKLTERKENGFDPYVFENHFHFLGIPFTNMGLKISYRPSITGLGTLHLVDGCFLTEDDGKLLTSAKLGVGPLEFECNLIFRMFESERKICIRGFTNYMKIFIGFSTDEETGHSGKIETLFIGEIEGLEVRITRACVGIHLINLLSTFLCKILKSLVRNILEYKLEVFLIEKMRTYQFPVEVLKYSGIDVQVRSPKEMTENESKVCQEFVIADETCFVESESEKTKSSHFGQESFKNELQIKPTEKTYGDNVAIEAPSFLKHLSKNLFREELSLLEKLKNEQNAAFGGNTLETIRKRFKDGQLSLPGSEFSKLENINVTKIDLKSALYKAGIKQEDSNKNLSEVVGTTDERKLNTKPAIMPHNSDLFSGVSKSSLAQFKSKVTISDVPDQTAEPISIENEITCKEIESSRYKLKMQLNKELESFHSKSLKKTPQPVHSGLSLKSLDTSAKSKVECNLDCSMETNAPDISLSIDDLGPEVKLFTECANETETSNPKKVVSMNEKRDSSNIVVDIRRVSIDGQLSKLEENNIEGAESSVENSNAIFSAATYYFLKLKSCPAEKYATNLQDRHAGGELQIARSVIGRGLCVGTIENHRRSLDKMKSITSEKRTGDGDETVLEIRSEENCSSYSQELNDKSPYRNSEVNVDSFDVKGIKSIPVEHSISELNCQINTGDLHPDTNPLPTPPIDKCSSSPLLTSKYIPNSENDGSNLVEKDSENEVIKMCMDDTLSKVTSCTDFSGDAFEDNKPSTVEENELFVATDGNIDKIDSALMEATITMNNRIDAFEIPLPLAQACKDIDNVSDADLGENCRFLKDPKLRASEAAFYESLQQASLMRSFEATFAETLATQMNNSEIYTSEPKNNDIDKAGEMQVSDKESVKSNQA